MTFASSWASVRGFVTRACLAAAGPLRAAAVLLLIGAVATTALARRAEASFGEAIVNTSQELLSWYGSSAAEGPRRLTINGLQLDVLSASSSATIRELFDAFAKQCRAHSGFDISTKVARSLESRASASAVDGNDSSALQGIFRKESESEGLILCLDTDRPMTPKDLLGRLTRYARSKDLSDFGKLRAMTARRTKGRTQALLMGSAGPMNLAQAFPKSGDVPGQEAPFIPRPPGSRRVLDSDAGPTANALHVYETEPRAPGTLAANGASADLCAKVPGIAAFYRRELVALGWRLSEGDTSGALMAERTASRLLILPTELEDCRVRTSLIELSK